MHVGGNLSWQGQGASIVRCGQNEQQSAPPACKVGLFAASFDPGKRLFKISKANRLHDWQKWGSPASLALRC
jgi:hypothetical protein